MTVRAVTFAGLDGEPVPVDATELDAFARSIAGSVLGPGGQGWGEAVSIWNAMAASRPALIVQPASPHDVAVAVRFAAQHGTVLTVKGRGHNIAGTSMADGALTLDMSRLADVTVDPAARQVHVGAGAQLGDVDTATQEHGLATTLGFVSKVGVAGLTLGGGFGYLARRFGWAVDNLAEVEILTADGRVRIANHEEHPDLFWAVRGGGGNFGVVTRFTFDLHEVGPMITGGLIAWDAGRIDEVLAVYEELTASAPRELTAAAIVRLAPPAPFVPSEAQGRPIVGLLICHSGTDPEGDLATLRELPPPAVDLVAEMPYAALQSMLDDMEPDGLNQYWKSEYLPELPTSYLDTFRDASLALTSPLSMSVIFHIGGALNDREHDDGAVGNRDAHFITGFSGTWTPEDPRDDEHIAWVRSSWERIRPFSTGGNYVNFQLADDDTGRTAAAYGKNYGRLLALKQRYDPHNLFRVNRNVAPVG